MSVATLIGIVAGLLLACSGVPQAVTVVRQGHAEGLALHTILLIMSGISLLSLYVYLQHGFDPILHSEYGLTLLVWGICLSYFIAPRTRSKSEERVGSTTRSPVA